MKDFVRKYGFLAGVAIVIAVAYVVPAAGTFLGRYGAQAAAVAVIFFLSGVTTRLKHVGDDLKNWRCHLLIQGFSFALIPVLFTLASGWMPDGALKYGVYLVAVVPTTISSCVVLTTAAGGRTSCALLNAVGGNLIGIALSPLLLGLLVGREGGFCFPAALRTTLQLCRIVLLPFVAGKMAGLALPAFVARVSRVQSYVAQGCILLIMFCAFAKSLNGLAGALAGMWPCFVYLAVAHVIFVAAATACTRAVKLSAPESTAAVFCATQKTLAMAIPLAAAFFAGTEVPLGVVILPIVFYHLFQLSFASFVVPYWARRNSMKNAE